VALTVGERMSAREEVWNMPVVGSHAGIGGVGSQTICTVTLAGTERAPY
jgi:hypothetical protein